MHRKITVRWVIVQEWPGCPEHFGAPDAAEKYKAEVLAAGVHFGQLEDAMKSFEMEVTVGPLVADEDDKG